MSKCFISISLAILLALSSALAQTSSPHKDRKARKVSKKQVVLPPAPVGPLPQVPLDQLPAAPPQVNFQNGRLSILAQNSTLGDILREVRKRTGASIEIPANATERVVASLGPAPPRDVLAALLNGTSFNYVMVGSVADPAALSSVTLSSRPAGGVTQTVAEAAPTPPEGPQPLLPGMRQAFFPRVQPVTPPPANPQVANADDSADDSQDDDDKDSDEAEGQGQQQNGATPQPNAGPKTPEEIMQLLQQRQQQGQPPQPPQPPQPNPQN